MFLNLLSIVLSVNSFHHQMVRFVWGLFQSVWKVALPGPPELCSKRCFVLTLFCHQMIRFVWGFFNLSELCPKMGSSCLDRLWKKQTLKVWYSFVTKHFHQNMFIALKTINIIWFKSFSQKNWQFLKKSILFFKLNIQHAFSAHALENETFVTDDNGESFCVCC